MINTPTAAEARTIIRNPDTDDRLRDMAWAWLQAQADLKAILRQSGTVDRLRIYTTLQARRQQDVHTHDWQPHPVWGDAGELGREVCTGCGTVRKAQVSAA